MDDAVEIRETLVPAPLPPVAVKRRADGRAVSTGQDHSPERIGDMSLTAKAPCSFLLLGETLRHSTHPCQSVFDVGKGHLKTHNGQFRLKLMGALQLWDPEGVEITPPGAKIQGLLALLATAKGAPCQRAYLQDKLWSDRAPKQGRDSLKKALGELRKILNTESCETLVTAGGAEILRRAHLAVDLYEPDQFDANPLLTPVFLEGLEIRDEEFETWLREMRGRLLAQAETAHSTPPAIERSTAKVGDHVEDAPNNHSTQTAPHREQVQVGLGILPIEGNQKDQTGRMIGDLLINRLIAMLNNSDLIRVHDLRNLAPSDGDRRSEATLQTQCLTIGTELHLTFMIRRASDQRIVWQTSRMLDLSRMTEAVIIPMIAEVSDILTARLLRPGMLGPEGKRNAAALVMSGIDHLFRLSDSNLKSAVAALDDAIAQDPRASYLAWRAFMTAFLFENAQNDHSGALREQAQLYAARALEADRYNPLVLSLVAHVHAFVLRNFERAFAVIDPLRGRNPNCIMFYDNLAMLHFYTGSMDRARERAAQAVALGRSNPYRYSFETSLLMIEAVSMNFDTAIAHGRRALAMQPDKGELFAPTLRYLTGAHAFAGDRDAALDCLTRLERQGAPLSVDRLLDAGSPVPSEVSREFLIEGLRRLE